MPVRRRCPWGSFLLTVPLVARHYPGTQNEEDSLWDGVQMAEAEFATAEGQVLGFQGDQQRLLTADPMKPHPLALDPACNLNVRLGGNAKEHNQVIAAWREFDELKGDIQLVSELSHPTLAGILNGVSLPKKKDATLGSEKLPKPAGDEDKIMDQTGKEIIDKSGEGIMDKTGEEIMDSTLR